MDGPPEGLRGELIRLVRESFPLSVLQLPENKEGVRAPSGRDFALEPELLLRDSKMYEAERNCKSKIGQDRRKELQRPLRPGPIDPRDELSFLQKSPETQGNH